MKICAVKGCSSAVRRRVWCTKHYTRFLRHGDPEGGGYSHGHVQKWVSDHISWTGDDCLIWPFFRDKEGAARFRHEGRDQIAARVICKLAHGVPPTAEHQAAHSCGKAHEGCVNPSHLRWATPSENNMDKALHGTSNRGERNPRSKLTKNQVVEIKSKLGAVSQRKLAAQYGVSQGAISDISKGANWGWV